MADRLTEKKEAAKKDEAYQPLWDTDQSIPEYMALLMGEQTQKNEDVELHEASDSEDSDGSNEPEDTSEDTPEDTHESRKDDEANHPVALASTEQAQQEQAQATHAYGEYVRLEHLGLQPGAILPVIPEPFFGIPDSELIEMRLLDRSLESSAPMQACAAHLNPVKAEENPISRAAELQPVGYVPINNPLAGSNIEEIEGQRTFWKAVLIVLLILNPFVLVPLVSMFDNNAGMSMLFFFIIIGLGSFFVVPILWIVGIVQAVKHKNRLRELIQKTKTVHAEFWYYLVYNRLPDDYTGINGYTKKHGFFDEYEALKRRERVKLRESAAPREAAAQREPAALHKPAAHPGSPDVEIQD
ncbi:pyruvate ferredoxin oxidoreductase [Rothia sp. HMSC071C12]|jgi:pyruvate synthase|uniref:pyruvate ferredoxin oxidoreductase n=1 Tax=Rothia TaxID=32207 RepID=UPI00066C3497|nr:MULTISPECIES: pyruvate ferredoxin oxidoreductase [Rothia]MBF1652134.1 pyruvate ferredoxin oxidoreductase [Rothia mucilaginosa]MBF1655505.1 pyruvate ferredoxin oxidoreductase [Rothia sp. (in: high G+C Gram-positive bacteria)]MBF1665742.1 pyruvate ferredoxin oxidoreductase [Rothia sp. (in: high G+C Gram-positive bacteria)]MBF1671589.1 pyruvate ferredoxin oxidoreductase [Rothia mucilaginosa]MDU2571139.1 pyruvate ferredoxin oxidoreductase [Rothia mucilaginosa]